MIQSLNLVEISTVVVPLVAVPLQQCLRIEKTVRAVLVACIFEKVGQFCFGIQERLFVTSLFSSLRRCKFFSLI